MLSTLRMEFDTRFENVLAALNQAQSTVTELEQKVTTQGDLIAKMTTEKEQLQATLEELEARVDYLEAINRKNGSMRFITLWISIPLNLECSDH